MLIRIHNKLINEFFIRIDKGNFEFAINAFGKFITVEGNYIKGRNG